MERLSSKITTRQLSLFFLVLAPLAKLLVLPSMLFFVVFRDAYLVVLLFGVVDIVYLSVFLGMMKKSNKSVLEIMNECIGKIGSRIVIGTYGLLFILKALVLSLETSELSISIIYEGESGMIVLVPIFLVLLYAGVSSVNSTFRTIELFAPPILISLFVLLFLSITSTDIKGVLPVLEYGMSPLMQGFMHFALWFGDFVILIPLLSDVRLKEKFKSKIIISYVASVAIVTVFFIVILGIFGVLAPRQLFFISKISKYSVMFSSIGRVDFVFLVAVMLGMLLYGAAMFCIGVKCIAIAIGVKKVFVATPIVVVAMIYLLMFPKKMPETLNFVAQYLSYFAIFMQYILPISIMIMFKITKRRELIYG